MNELAKRNLPVPFFSQRENQYRWKIRAKEDGPVSPITNQASPKKGDVIREVQMADCSCNITSLCMMLHYFGITTDTPDMMMEKAWSSELESIVTARSNKDFSSEEEILQSNETMKIIARDLYNIPESYLFITDNKDATLNLRQAEDMIAAGYPVWISFGPVQSQSDEQGRGHIAVLRGFTGRGDVIINDPWGDLASPHGFLTPHTADYTKKRGLYYNNGINRYYGLGNGDNCILRRGDFESIIKTNFHQALVIRYPHVWTFPKKSYDDAGTPLFYFSSPRFADIIAEYKYQKLFRDERMKLMLGHETIQDAGYPIAANSRHWHDGMHIKMDPGEPVYAAGPGRIVAARINREEGMPETGSNNFVLVLHPVKLGNTLTEFFSLYMHLAPVDIQKGIKEQLVPTQAEKVKYDWLDQILHYLLPKRAITKYIEDDTLKDDPSFTIYKLVPGSQTLEATNEKIQHQTVLYLCPVREDVRSFLEDIDPEKEAAGNPVLFYSLLNSDAAYQKQFAVQGAPKLFYAFYYQKVHTQDSMVSREVRYLSCEKIITQPINLPAYIHYRKKVISLMKGEVVPFSGEDPDSSTALVIDNEKRTKDGIITLAGKAAFGKHISLTKKTYSVTALYNAVKQYYLDLGTIVEDDQAKIMAGVSLHGIKDVIDDFERTSLEYSRYVLTFPQTHLKNLNDYFSVNHNNEWFRELKRTHGVILKTLYSALLYNEINNISSRNIAYSDDTVKESTEIVRIVIQKYFTDISFAEIAYRDFFLRIEEKFDSDVRQNPDSRNIRNRLLEACAGFSFELLHYPAERITNGKKGAFTKNDNWYKNMMTMLVNSHWKPLSEIIKSYMPANIDWYLEVNNNTRLGCAGNYKKTNGVIHFEIFSDSNLIDSSACAGSWNSDINNPCFVLVSDPNKDNYFNKTLIVKKLKESNFLEPIEYFPDFLEDFIVQQNLENYLRDTKTACPLNFVIAQHLYGHMVQEETQWEKLAGKGNGISQNTLRETLPYKYLSRELLDNIQPVSSGMCNKERNIINAACYHPVRFLGWLDQKYFEQAGNI